MAQTLRRPLCSVVGLTSTFERRCFSQIVPRQGGVSRKFQVGRPAQSPEKSFRIASKEAMRLPSDVGLLEQTFVAPTGRNRPSLFKSPKDVLKLQTTRVRSIFRDLFSLFVTKWSSPREGKRWYNRMIKLHRSQTAPAAIALHHRMYSAFAEGDVKTLREICTDGIYDTFQARIAARAHGEKVVWELVRRKGRAKVMVDRAARVAIDGAVIRQGVVRIRSTQKLTRYAADGRQIKGTGKAKDLVEYVVVQQHYWNNVGEPWQIWGTTKETTIEDVKEWEAKESAVLQK